MGRFGGSGTCMGVGGRFVRGHLGSVCRPILEEISYATLMRATKMERGIEDRSCRCASLLRSLWIVTESGVAKWIKL